MFFYKMLLYEDVLLFIQPVTRSSNRSSIYPCIHPVNIYWVPCMCPGTKVLSTKVLSTEVVTAATWMWITVDGIHMPVLGSKWTVPLGSSPQRAPVTTPPFFGKSVTLMWVPIPHRGSVQNQGWLVWARENLQSLTSLYMTQTIQARPSSRSISLPYHGIRFHHFMANR